MAGLLCLRIFSAAYAGVISEEASSDRPWQVQLLAEGTDMDHQRIFDVAFEPDGTAWLAVSNGLWRYDGYEWTHFGRENGLPSYFVRAVMYSRAGELWVGTDHGVGVYNYRMGHFDARDTAAHLPNQNVRRITEDEDGALWFSCDRWPDPSVERGGLVRYRNGKWDFFGPGQGIDSDASIGYFRLSSGRQFALTTNRWYENVDDRWELSSGSADEPIVRHMAQATDGTIFAQGEHLLLISSGDDWRVWGDNTLIVGQTSEGEVFALRHDQERGSVWFEQWTGRGFDRVSASTPNSLDARFHRMVEAPDGSIWCVGNSTILRWDRGRGIWQHFPDLPPPIAQDAAGRTWFVDKGEVIWRAAGVFHRLSGLKQFFGVDADGAVVGLSLEDRLVCIKDPTTEVVLPAEHTPSGITLTASDSQKRLWLMGNDGDGATFAMHRDEAGRWVEATVKNLQAPEFTSARADPDGGVTFVAVNRDTRAYHVLHARDHSLAEIDLGENAPMLSFPHYIHIGETEFLHAYIYLYQRSPRTKGRWESVPSVQVGAINDFVSTPTAAAWLYQDRDSGLMNAALFQDGLWTIRRKAYDRALDLKGTNDFALVGRGVIHRNHKENSFDYISLPEPETIHSVLQDNTGELWVGTPEGVFHRKKQNHPPRTMINAEVSQARADGHLVVSFKGASKNEPLVNPESFRYAWRIDQRTWSNFEYGSRVEIPMLGLEVGEHHLEAKAMDADGKIDPRHAGLDFTVEPVPLQDEPYFPYLVLGIMGMIAFLAWQAHNRAHATNLANQALRVEVEKHKSTSVELNVANHALQIARDELEQRVDERTRQLTEANTALTDALKAEEEASRQQRFLEQQLRESQKLEAIGTLAGGIAHDFNNILTIIIPCTNFAMESADDPARVREYLNYVLKAADRARNLVKQILTFSQRQKSEQSIVDLVPVMEEAVKLLRSAMPSTISITTHVEPDMPAVLADSHQMHQVLMNLCTNAQHAFPNGHGRIEISMDKIRLDAGIKRQTDSSIGIMDLPEGDYVRIGVRDNGSGMSEEVKDRIFEPFFTTKAPNKGTGLGLAVVHGIVREHGGAIRVWSKISEGTFFEIFLPAQDKAVSVISQADMQSIRGNGERVLLVDDEADVVTIISSVLRSSGYHVSAHHRPQEALEAYISDPDSFDLVITDFTMPGMTGHDFAKAILQENPAIPIMLITGFGDRATSEAGRAIGISKMLHKPFTAKVLLRTIHALLEVAHG